MVAPSGEGAVRCMRQALATNVTTRSTTSTRMPPRRRWAICQGNRGDPQKSSAAGDACPPISATKSLTGHSLGATGVQESIYSLLMMQNGFICESRPTSTRLDPDFADMPIVRKRIDNAKIDVALSNSFGFGGTNATLVFQRYATADRREADPGQMARRASMTTMTTVS